MYLLIHIEGRSERNGLVGGKKWSDEEIEKLKCLWGNYTIRDISVKMGRSVNSVCIKSKRLKLNGQFYRGDIMNSRQISRLMGVDSHTVTDYWIAKCGLPANKKRTRDDNSKIFYIIKYSSFLNWLKNNQDKWDSRRITEDLLIQDKWFSEKVEADRKLPKNRFKKWTALDDEKIKFLYYVRLLSYKEIAEVIERSPMSVERRFGRIREKEREKRKK